MTADEKEFYRYDAYGYGSKTFAITVPAGSAGTVRVYVGDAYGEGQPGITVGVEGGPTVPVTTPTTQFGSVVLSGSDADGDGVLTVTIGGPMWVANGLDFVLGGPAGLPPEAYAPPPASAAFAGENAAVEGAWPGTFGAEGFAIPQGPTSLPAYATLTPSGSPQLYTWASGSSDPRALAVPSQTGGIASSWYSPTAFEMMLNVSGTRPHRVSLNFLDWDGYGGGRDEQVELVDAATGVVLDSREVTDFTGGEYLSGDVAGRVDVRVTNLNASSNAVLNGVFFDPSPTRFFVVGTEYDARYSTAGTSLGAAGLASGNGTPTGIAATAGDTNWVVNVNAGGTTTV